MNINEIKIGEWYKVDYPNKKNLICKVLSIDYCGDCETLYKNNQKHTWHCSWLEEVK